MKLIFTFFISLSTLVGLSQNKPQSFFGKPVKDYSVCPEKKANALSEEQVEDMVTAMLDKIGITNSFIIIDCPQVANCQATVWTDGKPYILYNAAFLDKVKRLNFTEAELPGIEAADWETLTLLAHELGHLVNNHFTNPKPGTKALDWELEADKFAGFMIYMLKGKLSDALSVYNNPLISEKGSYTHPGRSDRKKAVQQGWIDAKQKYPAPSTAAESNKSVTPVKNNDANTVTDIDGNVYKTVNIGTQVWMQSNLDVRKFRDGTPIPEAKSEEEWETAIKEQKPAWCYYENNAEYGKLYGKLYNWFAVTDPRGLAPEGTHIPNIDEWEALVNFLGGSDEAGGKLKSTRYFTSPNLGATNSSGFSAIPGGFRISGKYFYGINTSANWWSTSIYNVSKDGTYIYEMMVFGYDGSSMLSGIHNTVGRSVRCIKD